MQHELAPCFTFHSGQLITNPSGNRRQPTGRHTSIGENIFSLFVEAGLSRIPARCGKVANQLYDSVARLGLAGRTPDFIQLLMGRPWFDIPIVYTNGGRAFLALEKGTPGDRAFYVAFAAWGQ